MISWPSIAVTSVGAAAPADPQRIERQMQELFKDAFTTMDQTFPVTSAVLVALGLVLLLASIWGWRWHQRRHLRSEPIRVFHQVASQVGMSLKQQWLLVRIARQQHLPTPLTLMLSGKTLEHHAQAYLQAASDRRRDALKGQIHAVVALLFDQSPAATT